MSSYLELVQREYTQYVFRLCCLCLCHFVSNLPKVDLSSGWVGTTNVDLSCIIEALQGFLQSIVSEGNCLIDPEFIRACLEVSEDFSNIVLQLSCNVWESVNVNDYEKKTELAKFYDVLKIASDVDSSSSVTAPAFIHKKLP